MRTPKIAGVVASSFLALILGAGVTGAAMSDHDSGVSQSGKNKNGTEQTADSKAYSEQANVNASKSDSEYGKGKGKHGRGSSSEAKQDNEASTSSKAKNDNGTKQSLEQEQEVAVLNFYKDHDRKGYDDKRKGDHKGDDGKRHDDKGHYSGGKWDKDDHGGNVCWCLPKDGHSGSSVGDVSQKGSNKNSTEQDAKSEATTKQANINSPIGGGGKGDVKQENDADTKSKASNDNWTKQELDQKQKVSSGSSGNGKGGSSVGDVTQKGYNSNETTQRADSKATTEQVNIYAPITVWGQAPSGDVHQSNNANTESKASNDNWTKQSVDQDQTVASKGGKGTANVSQEGGNSNTTDQSAKSSAKTQQVNIYAPISVYTYDGGHGYSSGGGSDVHQGNTADTHSSSGNSNGTAQDAGQDQAALAASGTR